METGLTTINHLDDSL